MCHLQGLVHEPIYICPCTKLADDTARCWNCRQHTRRTLQFVSAPSGFPVLDERHVSGDKVDVSRHRHPLWLWRPVTPVDWHGTCLLLVCPARCITDTDTSVDIKPFPPRPDAQRWIRTRAFFPKLQPTLKVAVPVNEAQETVKEEHYSFRGLTTA